MVIRAERHPVSPAPAPSMRPHLSLKASLAAAFGILALIAAGQGVLSIAKLVGIRHGVSEVATNWLPSVVAVNEIRAAASEVRIKQLRLLSLSGTPARLAENEAALVKTHDKLAQARTSYEPLISSNAERTLYEAFAVSWTRFGQADAEMRRLMERGETAAALTLMGGAEIAGLYDDARANLARDVALNEQGARRDADAALIAADAAMQAACVAVVLALTAACAAAAFGLLRVSDRSRP